MKLSDETRVPLTENATRTEVTPQEAEATEVKDGALQTQVEVEVDSVETKEPSKVEEAPPYDQTQTQELESEDVNDAKEAAPVKTISDRTYSHDEPAKAQDTEVDDKENGEESDESDSDDESDDSSGSDNEQLVSVLNSPQLKTNEHDQPVKSPPNRKLPSQIDRHVCLGAEDRLDPRLLGLGGEIDCPEEVAMVGDRHGIHPEILDPRHQSVDPVGAVEQAYWVWWWRWTKGGSWAPITRGPHALGFS